MPNNLLTIIKKAALDAVTASRPVNVVFGRVSSINPLSIYLDQKLTISGALLVATRRVADMISNEELIYGDHLVLLQMQGGQKYIALDKVVT